MAVTTNSDPKSKSSPVYKQVVDKTVHREIVAEAEAWGELRAGEQPSPSFVVSCLREGVAVLRSKRIALEQANLSDRLTRLEDQVASLVSKEGEA